MLEYLVNLVLLLIYSDNATQYRQSAGKTRFRIMKKPKTVEYHGYKYRYMTEHEARVTVLNLCPDLEGDDLEMEVRTAKNVLLVPADILPTPNRKRSGRI